MVTSDYYPEMMNIWANFTDIYTLAAECNVVIGRINCESIFGDVVVKVLTRFTCLLQYNEQFQILSGIIT